MLLQSAPVQGSLSAFPVFPDPDTFEEEYPRGDVLFSLPLLQLLLIANRSLMLSTWFITNHDHLVKMVSIKLLFFLSIIYLLEYYFYFKYNAFLNKILFGLGFTPKHREPMTFSWIVGSPVFLLIFLLAVSLNPEILH